MKKEIYILIFCLIILITPKTFASGNHLSTFQGKSEENTKRNVEGTNGNDNYMVIYFKEDCNYQQFSNIYRTEISFIINKENNANLTGKETLIIHKGFGIEIYFTKAIRNLENFFSRGLDENMQYLVSIDLTNFDSSLVTNMDNMFYGCSSLESIILSNSDITNVETMEYMFYGCISLKTIDLSNLKAQNLTNMHSMFNECKSLKSVNLSNFDSPKLLIMINMFFGCNSLEEVNFSNFHAPELYDMSNMFYGCGSLKSIDLSDFDTSQMSSINYLFFGCSSLRSIASYENIFSSISSIRYINLYNFKNDKIISEIFKEIDHILYVCQKENIITNQKAFNCCNYNFENDTCYPFNVTVSSIDSTIIEDTIKYITDESKSYTTDVIENNGTVDFPKENRNASSNKSFALIIGIIAGEVVIVIIFVVVIICWKRRKQANYHSTNNDTAIDSHGSDLTVDKDSNTSIIYEYQPENTSKNKLTIALETTKQYQINILIGVDKTMEELIKFYFESIKKPELFNDNSIRFLLNSFVIEHNSKKSIKEYIGKHSNVKKIIIDDLENKIY